MEELVKTQLDYTEGLGESLYSPSTNALGPTGLTAEEPTARPSRDDAEAAVRTLLRWAGDNPDREGLVDTPKRVVKAYEEYFQGYKQNVDELLERVFSEVENYNDMVLVRDINFTSHCEHHVAPFLGRAHIAYYPSDGVIGLSKLARLVDVFAHRLQTQETMTAQISQALLTHLKPRGVAVILEAEHMCMSMRGIRKQGSLTVTLQFAGLFENNAEQQARFYTLLRGAR